MAMDFGIIGDILVLENIDRQSLLLGDGFKRFKLTLALLGFLSKRFTNSFIRNKNT